VGQLYDVGRVATAKGLGDIARLALRRERSAPLLGRLAIWLAEQRPRVLPKGPMGQAIGYAPSNWVSLNRHLEAGFLAIDNNAAGRAPRPVAVGRKNWSFCGNDGGCRTAAILISLTATCTGLRIDPFAYLCGVLDLVGSHPARLIEELLPDRWRRSDSRGPSPHRPDRIRAPCTSSAPTARAPSNW
jgi:hypothetical protein